jgi:hypothetical protein
MNRCCDSLSVDLGCDRGNFLVSAKCSTLPRTTSACSRPLSSPAASCPPGIEGSGQSLADLLEQIVGPGRRPRTRQQRQRHPQRLAARGFHEPARRAHRRLHACHRPGPLAHRPACSKTNAASCSRARIARRMDWRLRRRLAGLRRRVAGHQTHLKERSPREGDPEFGISRGRLMPKHHVFYADDEIPTESARKKLQDSLVLVHGGMAQNVGPILEMVTEKYLLRSEPEWRARQEAHGFLDRILDACATGDIAKRSAKPRRENFNGPIQTIIPWASNHYTETLIEQGARRVRRYDFWGFWMLGGMAGGGMGFIFAPGTQGRGPGPRLQASSCPRRNSELSAALPFAMEPVVYDFAINERGTWADLLTGRRAMLADADPVTTCFVVPALLRMDRQQLGAPRLAELDKFAAACRTRPELQRRGAGPFSIRSAPAHRRRLAARPATPSTSCSPKYGFDRVKHEQIRGDLKAGRIGLAHRTDCPRTRCDRRRACRVRCNKLPPPSPGGPPRSRPRRSSGPAKSPWSRSPPVPASRWTQGAGVVKSLHPFCKLGGRHRTFLETHLAKSRRVSRRSAALPVPHIFTTSYLTHEPISADSLRARTTTATKDRLLLSEGKSDRPAHSSPPRAICGSPGRKCRSRCSTSSSRKSATACARRSSAGRKAPVKPTDYTDNLPLQCLHPVGHFYEIPNLLRNGTLAALLLASAHNSRRLLLHNIDTVGMNVDPALLGQHLESGRDPHLRSHHPPPRRSWRRPRPRQWPRAARRGPRDAARGTRIRPHLLQQ